MKLIGENKLLKMEVKNSVKLRLVHEIDKLIFDIEKNDWQNETELRGARNDADFVHEDGCYFFNILGHSIMILIEFDVDGEAAVVWAGNDHD
jgi:hypothetical protein